MSLIIRLTLCLDRPRPMISQLQQSTLSSTSPSMCNCAVTEQEGYPCLCIFVDDFLQCRPSHLMQYGSTHASLMPLYYLNIIKPVESEPPLTSQSKITGLSSTGRRSSGHAYQACDWCAEVCSLYHKARYARHQYTKTCLSSR